MSTTTQLASVRAAIAAIESGSQSIRMGERQLTKADLATLYKRESELLARLTTEATAAAGRGRNRLSFVVPD